MTKENLVGKIKIRLLLISIIFLFTNFLVFSRGYDPSRHTNSIVFLEIESTVYGTTKREVATGFITCDDGHVLTSIPIAEGSKLGLIKGSIGSRQTDKWDLDVIDKNEGLGLFLFKFKDPPSSNFDPVKFGNAAELKTHDALYLLGFPLKEALIPEKGSFSSRNGAGGRWLADVGIDDGANGAPILNKNGEVVAVA